jgi:N-acetylmuramoyl-L-alanine amidase
MTIVSNWIPSPNHRSRRGEDVEAIILHGTAGHGDEISLGRFFRHLSIRSSSHYGVGRKGGVAQYVSESRSAQHAGDGELPNFDNLIEWFDNVNPRSIGIEVCNRLYASSKYGRPRVQARHRNPRSSSTSWEAYPMEQMHSLKALVEEIAGRHPTCKYILAHEDVTNYATAGGSKLDMGPAFLWELFADCGLKRVWFNFEALRFEEAPFA